MKKLSLIVLLGVLILNVSSYALERKSEKLRLELEKYNGSFFSINKPRGWEIITAGMCADFAFLIRNPAKHLCQVFYFGEVGPVYINAQQKQIDRQYMNMGAILLYGLKCQWLNHLPRVTSLHISILLPKHK